MVAPGRPTLATMAERAGWRGTGECVVGLAWRRRAVGPVPPPLRRVLGPVLVVGARYDTSPVGPYLELAVAEPVRLGMRAGTCVTVMVVDSAASREAGRAGWSFPKELGTLRWSAGGDGTIGVRWEEGDVEVTGTPMGPAVPAPVPSWSLQAGDAGVVQAGALLRGRARLATVRVEVGSGSPLAALGGRHRGLTVAGGRLTMGRPRPVHRSTGWRP